MTRPGFNPDRASDIRPEAWIIRTAPKRWQPYLTLIRADRPIGTWLLLIPCLWSVTLASHATGLGTPDAWFVTLFAVGSFVMRSAGCVVNDLWDKDFDAQVARTAKRPIASGEISVKQALLFLGALLLFGFIILMQFNGTAITLGIASLALVAVYPLMKRVTYWPQAFLGLTFNWGALLAWAAVTGAVALPSVVMYAACVFWTLGYDTIYGHQDKEDDLAVGVKSSSIRLGRGTRPFVTLTYFATLALLAVAGNLVGMSWFYYLMLALAGVQMTWQIRTLDIDNPDNCLTRFKSNKDVGLMIFLGLLLG